MDKTIKLACLLAMVIFSSCASRKDFVYLQDMDELQEYLWSRNMKPSSIGMTD